MKLRHAWVAGTRSSKETVKMNSSRILARINGLFTAASLAVMSGGAAVLDNAKAANMACPAAGCGPVMVNPIKAYLIYWLPTGFTFDPNGPAWWDGGNGNYESLTQR